MLPEHSVLISVFYSQFHLSHKLNDYPLEPSFFWDGTNFIEELRIATPDDYKLGIVVPTSNETGSVRLHLHFGAQMPDLQSGVYAVTFPLRVLSSEDGPNTFCGCMGEDEGNFQVPASDYDVAAIFRRGVGEVEDEEIGLRHFEVSLHFLPRGTCTLFGVHYDRTWDAEIAAPDGDGAHGTSG